MPWQPKALMSIKQEFVELASREGANRRELCRRFCISPKTGYALLARHAQEGVAAFAERSRRPHSSPARTPAEIEQIVIELRTQHPCWGGRKIARRLLELGHTQVPPPSTITTTQHPVPPADQRQDRALPSLPQSRGASWAQLCRSAPGLACLCAMARCLQP